MIIVRENQEETTRAAGKAFCVYVRLPDGTEHELIGIRKVQEVDGPRGQLHEISIIVDKTFVSFE